VNLTHRIQPFAAASRQIVGKPDSYGLRPESEATSRPRFCPEGVGALLAGDRPGTGRDSGDWVNLIYRIQPFAAASRQIVGKPDSYGLRPESKATSRTRFCPEGVGALLAGDRPGTGRDSGD